MKYLFILFRHHIHNLLPSPSPALVVLFPVLSRGWPESSSVPAESADEPLFRGGGQEASKLSQSLVFLQPLVQQPAEIRAA